MVVISKLLKYLVESDAKCIDLIHKGTCKKNAMLNTYKFLLSNMKYFAPVMGVSASFERECRGLPFK